MKGSCHMKRGKSYIKDTNDFFENLKKVGKVLSNAFFPTEDVIWLYPNIPHDSYFKALFEELEE